ncbi:MAG: DNA methyltransferase, partial [bacterium]
MPYRLILLYSYHGDSVLDPFLGIGTTTKVAKALGREFWG